MKANKIKSISLITLFVAVFVMAAILSFSNSISYAEENNYIEYNSNKYYFEDTSFLDKEEHDTLTLCRTYYIKESTDDAKVNVGLYMPKGKYTQMYISSGLYSNFLSSTFEDLVDTTKYKKNDYLNFYLTQEKYNVRGFDFLTQTYFNDLTIALEDDIDSKYSKGDVYHDNNDGTIYKIDEYTEKHISNYVLNDINDTYYVESALELTAYYQEIEDSTTALNVKVIVKFEPEKVSPVQDGDIFKATAKYSYSNDLASEFSQIEYSYSYISFGINEEAFDTSKCGYDANIDPVTKLPLNASLQYIVNGTVVVDTKDSYVLIKEFPENEYTVQGLLSFETNLGEKVSIKSNVLTIKKHTFDLRTNNIYSSNVKVNEAYSYSLSIDRSKLTSKDLIDVEYGWFFNIQKEQIDEVQDFNVESPSFAYTQEGTKYVLVELNAYLNEYEMINFRGIFEQIVSINPIREIPNYDITFNVDNDSTLVVGGDMVDIRASINEVYGDEAFEFKYYLSLGSFADNISQDPAVPQISPMASGKIIILCKATSESVGEFEKSITLNIVDPKSDKVEIYSKNSFNKNGNDLIAILSIGGKTNFINYKPSWKVQKEDGDKLVDTAFSINEYGNAVISEASTGYYSFSINDGIVTSEDTKIRVSKYNMAEIAKKGLPFVAVFMVIAVILFALIKKKVLVGKTVEKQLIKIDVKLAKSLSNKEYTKKDFTRDMSSILLKVKNAINIAEELDQASFGQHKPLIDKLIKIKKIVIAASLKIETMDMDTMKLILEKLKNVYVEPSIKLSSDINEVMNKFSKERTKNIMVVDPNAKDEVIKDEEDNI